mgnify:CR=1 FL=1
MTQQIQLRVGIEQTITSEQLDHDAPKGPHVDACSVGNSHDDLRGAIKAGLDVGVDALVLEAAASVVNDFYAWFVWLFQEDVLWLEIAMNNVVVTLELKSLKNLYCKSADQSSWDTLEVILFDEFVKIHTK